MRVVHMSFHIQVGSQHRKSRKIKIMERNNINLMKIIIIITYKYLQQLNRYN